MSAELILPACSVIRGRFTFNVSYVVLKSECECDMEAEQASAGLSCKLSSIITE